MADSNTMIVCGVLQTLMALSNISPHASAQFTKLAGLAAGTTQARYVTAATGLLVRPPGRYQRHHQKAA